MNKFVFLIVLVLCLSSCSKDNYTIYCPVGNVDIESGSPAREIGEDSLIARSYNNEDYVLDTLVEYPNNPTLGKLTFMINLKNQLADDVVANFNGAGKSLLTMSLGYKDGNYPIESQIPIYTSQDPTKNFTVRLRLKGELELSDDEWMIDYIYAQLAGLFHPYPPMDYPEVFMCKGGMKFGTFDSFRRTCTFDIQFNRSDLFFDQLYFNLFINLAGQKRKDNVRLRIDKESYFEIYQKKNEQ